PTIVFLIIVSLRPRPLLFPYTTLFRSHEPGLADPAGSSWAEFAVISDDTGALGHLLALGYPLAVKDGNPLHGAALMSSPGMIRRDRKSTRLNSSHVKISYAVFCLKKKS